MSIPRHPKYDGPFGASAVLCAVRDYIRKLKYTRHFPKSIASALGLTKTEVVLALWNLRTWKEAKDQEDGRWNFVDTCPA